jgi:hypothetical protein
MVDARERGFDGGGVAEVARDHLDAGWRAELVGVVGAPGMDTRLMLSQWW